MKRAIELRLEDGDVVTVDAEILEPFGIARYPSAEHPHAPYSVTHIKTGLAAARARTKKGALATARRLRDIRGIDWRDMNARRAKELPSRVLRIVHRIRKEALEV